MNYRLWTYVNVKLSIILSLSAMRSMQLSVIWGNSESQCAMADSETPGRRQGQQRRLRPSSALRPPVSCYGSVSHAYCKSEMLWFMSVSEGRKVDQKCITNMFSVKNLSLCPRTDSCTGVIISWCFSLHVCTNRCRGSSLKPAKMSTHIAKCYHACPTDCDVNSPQGPADPKWALWKKHPYNGV